MATVTFDKATRLYPGGTRPAVDKLDLDIADGGRLLVHLLDLSQRDLRHL